MSPASTSSGGKSTIEIRLLGQKISLRAPNSDPELVREVVELVGSKLGEIEKRAKGASAHQVALLALLELAEEYMKAKRRTLELKKSFEEKSGQLSRLIEAELK